MVKGYPMFNEGGHFLRMGIPFQAKEFQEFPVSCQDIFSFFHSDEIKRDAPFSHGFTTHTAKGKVDGREGVFCAEMMNQIFQLIGFKAMFFIKLFL